MLCKSQVWIPTAVGRHHAWISRERRSNPELLLTPIHVGQTPTKPRTNQTPKPDRRPQDERVRVMVCYVLRPSPDNSYFGLRCSICLFGCCAQCGVGPPPARPPARPAGLPAAARTALLGVYLLRLSSPTAHTPRGGLPEKKAITPRCESV